jgi:hypothetical protein
MSQNYVWLRIETGLGPLVSTPHWAAIISARQPTAATHSELAILRIEARGALVLAWTRNPMYSAERGGFTFGQPANKVRH